VCAVKVLKDQTQGPAAPPHVKQYQLRYQGHIYTHSMHQHTWKYFLTTASASYSFPYCFYAASKRSKTSYTSLFSTRAIHLRQDLLIKREIKNQKVQWAFPNQPGKKNGVKGKVFPQETTTRIQMQQYKDSLFDWIRKQVVISDLIITAMWMKIHHPERIEILLQ